MAPAEPGDGWDKTALTMRSKLQAEKSSGSVQVLNAPGAGGTIELAQFVNQNKDDPSQLIVGGLVMVGATSTNNPPVNLDAIMPIALLSGEYESIVTTSSSDIQNLGDLVTKLTADPDSVSRGGCSSARGTDHITAGRFAKAVGVDPTKVNYIAFCGGREALAAIFETQVTVDISSDERIKGIDSPTFKEGGVDLPIQNWLMVGAATDITAE
ncbi:hypothetical protein RI570_16450 [Brucella pseudogrignonensis]|nr:hypothetical protein [Brucella pseudogrignonensis]MDT6941707.1 hypothetical protein [Brucella pseudogrignonensis]